MCGNKKPSYFRMTPTFVPFLSVIEYSTSIASVVSNTIAYGLHLIVLIQLGSVFESSLKSPYLCEKKLIIKKHTYVSVHLSLMFKKCSLFIFWGIRKFNSWEKKIFNEKKETFFMLNE